MPIVRGSGKTDDEAVAQCSGCGKDMPAEAPQILGSAGQIYCSLDCKFMKEGQSYGTY